MSYSVLAQTLCNITDKEDTSENLWCFHFLKCFSSTQFYNLIEQNEFNKEDFQIHEWVISFFLSI
jgi:hypothetical protein